MAFVGSGIGCLRRSLPCQQMRLFHSTCPSMVSKGDRLPTGSDLMYLKGGAPTPIKVSEIFSGKKVALITIPGALTPTCQDNHVKDWVAAYGSLKAKGIDSIVCISVNDAFVMDVFEKKTEATGKIDFYADGGAGFVKAAGIDVDTGAFGGVRAVRGSYLVEDGEFTAVNTEDGTKYEGAAKPETILAQLDAIKA